MPKKIPRKKTAGRRTKGADSIEAHFPFFNNAVLGYEKWARETLAGKTGPFKRDSPEWFAKGIIRYVEEIRFFLAEAATDRAAEESLRLGSFIDRMKEAVFGNREERRKNIIFGVTARMAQQKRRKKQAIIKAAKTAELHEKIKTRAAELRVESKRGKGKILEREFDLSWERIRAIIREKSEE